MKKQVVIILSILSWSLLFSCTQSFEKLEYERAEKERKEHKYVDAVRRYQKILSKETRSEISLLSAHQAAEITDLNLKDYPLAVLFYKYIVVHSPIDFERLEAQKKLAGLYFNQLSDYKQSVVEYSRLLELPHSNKEGTQYRMNLARSYYYQGNIFQSLIEIDSIIKDKQDSSSEFEALALKANIFLGAKRIDDAIVSFKELIQKFPNRSLKENLAVSLAVCYEEKKDFGQAIATLENIKSSYPNKEFIENRISRLKDRKAMLPGANGFHK